METEAIEVGIVMQRIALQNRWQPYQWRPLEIVGEAVTPDGAGRCLRAEDGDTRWLFPGFEVRLFSDEAEGYFLNINAAAPCWFIMWRLDQVDGVEVALPKTVTLSYNEAARLMDGGEQVDTLPLSPATLERLVAFTQVHYQPEHKRKRKHPSFEGGAEVERMARAEGGQHGS